ncbi:MAG TPA: conjugal transfer protein TraF [Aquifex aeolicus]|nr:conjugal transfer protein TraF [Aquifex aeolicus]
MGKYTVVFLSFLILGFGAERGLFFKDVKAERGIFFGEIKKEKKKEEKERKEEKEKFEFPVNPNAPEPVKEFLLNPTEENAKEFLKWQAKYFAHLNKIGTVLRQAYLKYGPQIYPIMGYPESVLIATNYPELRSERFRKVIEKVKDKVGIIYFFSSKCRFCKLQTPLIEKLYRDYGLEVRAVSIDGGLLETDIPQVVNPGLAIEFGIRGVPATVVVIANEGEEPKFYPIAIGFTPLDQIQAQILRVLILEGLIKPEELNLNYFVGDKNG